MNVLKTMRSMTTLKILLWLVVFSFIAAMFTVWGGGMDVEKSSGGIFSRKFAVKVDGKTLSPDVFKFNYRVSAQRMVSMFGEKQAQRYLKGMGQRVMAQMVNELLLEEMARSYGLRVSDKEIAYTIEKWNHFDNPETDYPEMLSRMGTDATTYQRIVKNELLLQKLDSVLTDGVYFSDSELRDLYRKENEKFKASVCKIPTEVFLAREQMPDEEAVKARYEKEKANLKTPEKRAIQYVALNTFQVRKLIKVTDDEVKNYYSNHLDRFSTPKDQRRASHILIKVEKGAKASEDRKAEKKTEDILNQIRNGADFAEMAQKYSDDPGSKKDGGDIRWFSKQQMVKPFSDAVFKESLKVGDVVGPIKTQFGYHIIKLTGIGGSAKPFEQVKSQVRQVMLLEGPSYVEKTEKLMEDARKALGSLTDDKAMEKEAKKYSTKVVSLKLPFSREDGIPGFGTDKNLMDAIFSADSGKWKKPVELGKRWIRFKVTDIQTAHPSTFDEVKLDIAKKIQRERAEEKAKEAAVALLKVSGNADAFKAQSRKDGYRVQDSVLINLEASLPFVGQNLAVLKKAINTPVGNAIGPFKVDSGWADLIVLQHQKPDMDKFEKDKDSFAARQKQKIVQQMQQDYVNNRKKQLDEDNSILYNSKVIEEMEKRMS